MSSFSIASNISAQAESGKPHAALRQLRPPENILITIRDQKPISFSFRGKCYHVERAYGPWLSSGDWWNPNDWEFEQWDLFARSQDGDSLHCCLMRDLTHDCWQMAALYD